MYVAKLIVINNIFLPQILFMSRISCMDLGEFLKMNNRNIKKTGSITVSVIRRIFGDLQEGNCGSRLGRRVLIVTDFLQELLVKNLLLGIGVRSSLLNAQTRAHHPGR